MATSVKDILKLPFYKVKNLEITRKTALECLKVKPILLTRMKHLTFYKNGKFLLEAIALNPVVIRFIDKQFKDKLKFMLKISQIEGTVRLCYIYASTKIQLNNKFKKNLINNDVHATLALINFYVDSDIIRLGLTKDHNVFTVLNINIQTYLSNSYLNASKLIDINSLLFQFIPADLKTNTQLIKIALTKNPRVYTYLPECITGNIINIRKLIDINPFIIQFFPEELKQNRSLLMYAINKDGLVLKYINKIDIFQICNAIISNEKIISCMHLDTFKLTRVHIKDFLTTNHSIKLFLTSCSHFIYKRDGLTNQNEINTHKVLTYHGVYQGLKLKKRIIEYIGNKYMSNRLYILCMKTYHTIKQYKPLI